MVSKIALNMIRKFTFISELGDLIQYLKSQNSCLKYPEAPHVMSLGENDCTMTVPLAVALLDREGIVRLMTSAIAQVNWIFGLVLPCDV